MGFDMKNLIRYGTYRYYIIPQGEKLLKFSEKSYTIVFYFELVF